MTVEAVSKGRLRSAVHSRVRLVASADAGTRLRRQDPLRSRLPERVITLLNATSGDLRISVGGKGLVPIGYHVTTGRFQTGDVSGRIPMWDRDRPAGSDYSQSSQAATSEGMGLQHSRFKQDSSRKRTGEDLQSVQNRSQSMPACAKSLHAKWRLSHSLKDPTTRFVLPSLWLLA